VTSGRKWRKCIGSLQTESPYCRGLFLFRAAWKSAVRNLRGRIRAIVPGRANFQIGTQLLPQPTFLMSLKTSRRQRLSMQSRVMSLVEAAANVLVDYGAAVATQMMVFPWFGLSTTLGQNLQMGLLHRGVAVTELPVETRLQSLRSHRKNLTPPIEMSAKNSLPIPMIPSRRRRWISSGISVRLGTNLSNGSRTVPQWGVALNVWR
jgi:hypothetical protein